MLHNKLVFGLTGNQLKLLALVCMTCDHVYRALLPQYAILNIIGRLAFPVFSYMIAEGCRYTSNRARYLGIMALTALLCQVVYFVVMGSLYQCILVTFSLSILLIYLLDYSMQKPTPANKACALLGVLVVFFVAELLPQLLPNTDFYIDYGMAGILVPALIFFGKNRLQKLLLAAFGLCLVAISQGGIQWFSLLALLPLALYNGRRGKWNLKYLFYIYYPAHLAVLQLLRML